MPLPQSASWPAPLEAINAIHEAIDDALAAPTVTDLPTLPPEWSPSSLLSSLSSWLSSATSPLTSWLSSLRESVKEHTSVASVLPNGTVLLLILLRLNRHIVPFLLVRFRRLHSIYLHRTALDVAQLVSSSSASTSYNAIDNDNANDQTDDAQFTKCVREEQLNRMRKFARSVFPDSLARYCTAVMLVAAWAIICTLGFAYAGDEFDKTDRVMYAGSLLVSGITSEWDILCPYTGLPPNWMHHLATPYGVDVPVVGDDLDGDGNDGGQTEFV